MRYRKVKEWVAFSWIAFAGSLSAINVLPVEIGGPVQISPTPGPANPDPILQNLVTVMDNFFQTPYYPGGAPDYLSQIYYFSDLYIGHGITFDPFDDKTVHFSIGQNFIKDNTQTFYYAIIGSNTFLTSTDKAV